MKMITMHLKIVYFVVKTLISTLDLKKIIDTFLVESICSFEGLNLDRN